MPCVPHLLGISTVVIVVIPKVATRECVGKPLARAAKRKLGVDVAPMVSQSI